MNPDQSLQTSLWIMLALQTIGSVDMPGAGARKLPSPRQYVAIVVAWVVLLGVSGASPGAGRAAAATGWLLVLAGMVSGPFGTRAVSFLNTVSQQFNVAAPVSAANAGTAAGSAVTAVSEVVA